MGEDDLLSEAVKTLVDRFPSLPPSEAWKFIDPQLAATIHLRYLDVYNNNQQLLLHLCENNLKSKAMVPPIAPALDTDIPMETVVPYNHCSNICNSGDLVPYNNHQEIVPYTSTNNNHIDRTEPIPFPFPYDNYNQRARVTDSKPEYKPTNYSTKPKKHPKSGVQGVTYNKYKTSWCVSLVDADGRRRRKFFNVKKYGFDGAKALALDYLLEYHRNAFQSQTFTETDVALDKKERNLVQGILHKLYSEVEILDLDKEKIPISRIHEYSERFRQKFSEICGLVFIPALLTFVTVSYDSSEKRSISVFPMKDSSFEDAIENAIKTLQSSFKRSKISGILPFHSDKDNIYATCYDLNLDKTKTFSLKNGFVSAHKQAISFRKSVIRELRDKDDDGKISGILKFPGVYYDSFSNCWVSSCSHSGKRREVKFYVKKHGAICARELAIRHRMKSVQYKQQHKD